MKKIFYVSLIVFLISVPLVDASNPDPGNGDPIPSGFVASRTSCSSVKTFSDLTYCVIDSILSPLIPILIGLALVYFLYGLLVYVKNAGNGKEQAKGSSIMVYGIIALFVMVSVWGLVGILAGVFNLNTATVQTRPTINIPK